MPHHRVFAECKADLKCFRVTKEAAVRRFAKAALDSETDVELNGKAAEAAVKVAFLVPEAATADSLWSPPDGLRLFQCTTESVFFF